ncbi:molybdenum cofactor biosynthesis protein MoaD [Gracilibacillus boraciitolerans JCM 21714]|uniref:Molybdopterin synthase sulfur carrier subunit n=1 Tax=Gracilibacillus boraciitolerans JCM 21714 TaxID=1298598 RepID=W4VME7_9BACI|nr:molybdopterin converting factor subunit 1 [Gracilibacillus boraciitolerans]GAE93983.1 molybdenum cofactor biosynthesis protein MoaD [Gracilibacillus boraciitolerans JCM 21714]
MIEILLFAQLQEQAGTDKIYLDDTAMTVKQLKEKLYQEYSFQQIEESMIAINEAYALDDDPIYQGDTIAIIPPVSGG